MEVGLRDGARRTIAPEPAPVEGRPDAGLLDAGDVLLVTGGARGITAEATVALAQAAPGLTLVLVGRTPLTEEDPADAGIPDDGLKPAVLARLRAADPAVTPATVEAMHRRIAREREVRRTVARLEAAGARVDARPCDVRDAGAFAALVEDVYAVHGRIDGVIHGAGLIEDKLIADKDLASFERVLATKVTGAAVLARTLRPEGLRFLVLFSSVSARFGNRGQADYAAAGEALNKLAQHLDRRWDGRVVAINWGPWLTTGMVSPAVQRQFAERGVALIDVPTGCRMLEDELRFGRKGEAEVVIGGTTASAPAAAPAAETPRGALLAAAGVVTAQPGGGVEVTRTFDLAHDLYLTDHRLDGTPGRALRRGHRADGRGRGGRRRRAARRRAARHPRPARPRRRRRRARGPRRRPRRTATPSTSASPRPAIPGACAIAPAPCSARRSRPTRSRPSRSTALPAFPMSVPDAYRDLLFHGPLFQGIVSVDGMDERGLRAVLRPTPPARVLTGAGAAHWWMDPVTVDCALQLQVIWARLNWGVTLLPAEIGAARPVAGLAGDAIRLELRVRPDSRAPLCHADHVFTSLDGRLLGTLTDVVGTGIEGPQPARGRGRERMTETRRRHRRHVVPVPRRARRRHVLAQHPRQGRRDLGPAARGVGTPTSTTTPTSATRTPRTPSAAATSARWRPSTRSRTASRRSRSAASRTSGSRCRSPATRWPTPARSTCPRAVRERTSIVLGKGTYLNGGNAVAVQRGLVIGQTMELLRRLHPEHPEEELEALRREMQRVLPPLTADTVPGLIPNIIVGRIANRLDLMGPAYTVDAACASSLVALAARRPRPARPASATSRWPAGRRCGCRSRPEPLLPARRAQPPRRQLRPFDKDSDGTLLGEGIGMVVLKRLADADRDGDRVYAVIRGVGVASDGRGDRRHGAAGRGRGARAAPRVRGEPGSTPRTRRADRGPRHGHRGRRRHRDRGARRGCSAGARASSPAARSARSSR